MVKPRMERLTEYQTRTFAAESLPAFAMHQLHKHYASHVHVTPPTAFNNQQWELTAQGYAGTIPLTPDFHLTIEPKLPIANLLSLIAYVYELDFQLFEDVTYAHSLSEFYEVLARLLAQRCLQRHQRGMYRTYQEQVEETTTLRGQIDLQYALTRLWQVAQRCTVETFTADVPHNQLLCWTLYHLQHSVSLTDSTRALVHQAYRTWAGIVSLAPISTTHLTYNRLNQEDAPLHTLCRFYLENLAPSYEVGEEPVFPFLIDMGRLYEQFVAKWLQAHLPAGWRLIRQENVIKGEQAQLQFKIDLVLYDQEGQPRVVLDTKYKTSSPPDTRDIQQIIAYAHVKQCRQAVLIYPQPISPPFQVQLDNLTVRALPFALDKPFDQAGEAFLKNLRGLEDL